MSSLNSKLEKQTVPILIPQSAFSKAQKFANMQPTKVKAEQVFRNILAVCIVHDYLKLFGIPSDIKAGDSWKPVLRQTGDIADLVIAGKGKVECRTINSNEEACSVPLEAQHERLAYFVIRIDDDQSASILGFATNSDLQDNQIAVSQLRDLIDFPDFLENAHSVTYLRLWLESVFQSEWKAPPTLLTIQQLHISGFHAAPETIQRVKLLEWKSHSNIPYVVLLAAVCPDQDETMNVRIQLHPYVRDNSTAGKARFVAFDTTLLLPDLRLSLLTCSGEVIREVVSRNHPSDNFVQLPEFQGDHDEVFVIRVGFETESIIQQFVI